MFSDAFYAALAQRESRGDHTVVNQFGFMGLYQMGPAALQDVGYMDGSGNWTGRDGIRSQNDFLNNRTVQEKAIREYHVKLWSYLPPDVQGCIGRTVKGINVTKSGLVAAAHLRGQGGITRLIRSDGQDDDPDEIGTLCSEYLKQFGGY